MITTNLTHLQTHVAFFGASAVYKGKDLGNK